MSEEMTMIEYLIICSIYVDQLTTIATVLCMFIVAYEMTMFLLIDHNCNIYSLVISGKVNFCLYFDENE